MNEPLKAGAFTVSMQASSTHYCTPRTDGQDPNTYDTYEVAILLEEGRRFDVRTQLAQFPWAERFESGRFPVAGYVPRFLDSERLSEKG